MSSREEQLKAFGRLLDIMDTLREKCPWDRKQTFDSLRQNTIEEAFELATAIAFQSAVQNFALTPMCLDESVTPRFEVDFMRQVPTLWDETRFLDGYPGRYIVMARRSGNRWYAIAMNGQQAPLSIDVQLPMFAGQQVTLLSDGDDGQSPTQRQVTLDKNGTLQATIPSGCAVMLFK